MVGRIKQSVTTLLNAPDPFTSGVVYPPSASVGGSIAGSVAAADRRASGAPVRVVSARSYPMDYPSSSMSSAERSDDLTASGGGGGGGVGGGVVTAGGSGSGSRSSLKGSGNGNSGAGGGARATSASAASTSSGLASGSPIRARRNSAKGGQQPLSDAGNVAERNARRLSKAAEEEREVLPDVQLTNHTASGGNGGGSDAAGASPKDGRRSRRPTARSASKLKLQANESSDGHSATPLEPLEAAAPPEFEEEEEDDSRHTKRRDRSSSAGGGGGRRSRRQTLQSAAAPPPLASLSSSDAPVLEDV